MEAQDPQKMPNGMMLRVRVGYMTSYWSKQIFPETGVWVHRDISDILKHVEFNYGTPRDKCKITSNGPDSEDIRTRGGSVSELKRYYHLDDGGTVDVFIQEE